MRLGCFMAVLDAREDYQVAQKAQNPRGGRYHMNYRCNNGLYINNMGIWLKRSEMTSIMIIRALS
jgi:hypothetical protein